MLTPKDLKQRWDVPGKTLALWVCQKILPRPILVGGKARWRAEDIDAFEDYLADRADCRESGLDPDGPNGPPPPVYSTGQQVFDPRAATARLAERERQQRSRTLAAGCAPMAAEEPVSIPALVGKKEEVKK